MAQSIPPKPRPASPLFLFLREEKACSLKKRGSRRTLSRLPIQGGARFHPFLPKSTPLVAFPEIRSSFFPRTGGLLFQLSSGLSKGQNRHRATQTQRQFLRTCFRRSPSVYPPARYWLVCCFTSLSLLLDAIPQERIHCVGTRSVMSQRVVRCRHPLDAPWTRTRKSCTLSEMGEGLCSRRACPELAAGNGEPQ